MTPSPSRPSEVPSPTPFAEPVATPAPAGERPTPIAGARRGGTLDLASRENIAHQDVHQELSPALSTWGPGIVYSRLLRFESGPGVELPSLAVECELCESWNMEDTTTFVFRLRPDVRWQDLPPVNGRALRAGDLVYSYTRQRQPDWPNAELLQLVWVLGGPQPDTLRISLTVPDADFMASLADGHSKVVAREAVEQNGDLKRGPSIGTGPWVLTETQPDASHIFVANPDYFEAGLPLIDKLTIHIITDAATRNAAFRVGTLDVQQMEPHEWADYRQQQPDAAFLMARESGAGLEVALKTSRPPFDDVRVRRAAFLAMDPWRAIEDIWSGAAYISSGIPPAEAGWPMRERELREFLARPYLARDLLRNADLAATLDVSIKVGNFGDSYLGHARRIADEMTAVGFEPSLEIVNRRVFGENIWLGGDYQMFVGPTAPVTTPNGYMLPVLHSLGQWNTTEHRDGELDRLIESQAQEFDARVRRDLVHQIQRRVLEQAYRFMPAGRVSIWTWWPRVRNFHPNFAGFEYSHWARVWLDG